MIDVLVADDQELVRLGLRALLCAEPDLRVVGEAGDGAAAVELCRRTRPDVVLMDVRMPLLDGIEATRRITAEPDLAHTAVLVLTTFEDDEYLFEALRRGARGFVVKDTPPAQLLEAIRVVAGGEGLLSPSVTTRLTRVYAAQHSRDREPHPLLWTLTPREVEVLALVGRGLRNEEIAEELRMSPDTARTHVSRTMAKLGARDRAQLVVFAFQSGLAW